MEGEPLRARGVSGWFSSRTERQNKDGTWNCPFVVLVLSDSPKSKEAASEDRSSLKHKLGESPPTITKRSPNAGTRKPPCCAPRRECK
jgi:hypothetical protein